MYGSLLAAFLFLFLFCGVICFRKKCLKIFPSKIKVPKPMIMISLKELEEESSYFYVSALYKNITCYETECIEIYNELRLNRKARNELFLKLCNDLLLLLLIIFEFKVTTIH